MASVPLILSGQRTGLTITASVVRVLPSVAPAVPASVPETSTQGTYIGAYDAAASSTYTVTFTDETGKKCGYGEFTTDADGNEITIAPVAEKVARLAVDAQGRVMTANPAAGPTQIDQVITEGTWEVTG